MAIAFTKEEIVKMLDCIDLALNQFEENDGLRELKDKIIAQGFGK